MWNEIAIVEKKGIKIKNPVIVEGLPDVGLVGAIAASHLVIQLELDQIGYIESGLFPPAMVIHKGELQHPVRIYGDENLIVLVSEIPMPVDAIYPLAESLTEWSHEKNPEMIISLNGLPVPNRMDIDEPSVFGVGNNEEAKKKLEEKNIEFLEEGFISGIYALVLRECSKKGIAAISLLSQCFPLYPDPGAAASALLSLDKFLNRNIDVKMLLDQAEEIKIKARDLMKQTAMSMPGMQKGMEQEIPIMYG
ncbi:MAG: proteasome assembly chaperone family protein [Candidatus Syntropharchaeia archaeon]